MTLRIGILGAARVATYAMIDPARDTDGVVVQGIAARDPARAKAYAATHGIPKTYPDYQALIDADDIDAVYIALPPNLHAHWAIAALNAGKPVLCEKPFTLNTSEVQDMLRAEEKSGKLLMEAQHSHYHPLSARMREVAHSGVLGDLRQVQSRFLTPVSKDPGEIRYLPDVGGGALWDLGVYCVYWIRSVAPGELRVESARHTLAESGADLRTHAQLDLGQGAKAMFDCDMDAPTSIWLRMEGSRGSLHVTNPLAPQSGHRFILTIDGHETTETFSDKPSYAYQLEAFRDALRDRTSVPTRGLDSLKTTQILEAIARAAAKGKANAD